MFVGGQVSPGAWKGGEASYKFVTNGLVWEATEPGIDVRAAGATEGC